MNPSENPIQSILNLRYLIDHNFQLVNQLPKSREVASAYTNLQLAKMWLGKVLKAFGERTPYPDSKNPANEKIEPTADKASAPEFEPAWSHVQRVKHLRGELEFIETHLKAVRESGLLFQDPFWGFEHLKDAIKNVILASMWLGMEIANHYTPNLS